MKDLGKNIEEKMKYLFQKGDFIFNVIKLRMNKIKPFRIFCHTLYFVRRSRNLNKCRFCTCFFIDDVDAIVIINLGLRGQILMKLRLSIYLSVLKEIISC